MMWSTLTGEPTISRVEIPKLDAAPDPEKMRERKKSLERQAAICIAALDKHYEKFYGPALWALMKAHPDIFFPDNEDDY